MENAKILITGGAGFIGSFIAKAFLKRGIPVVLFDAFIQYFTPLQAESRMYHQFLKERFKDIQDKVIVVRGDTRDADGMRRAINKHKPTHIIHLAAVPLANLFALHSNEIVSTIYDGTVNLLEIIRDVDFVKRFVYISSSMVYGDFDYVPADEKHPKQPKNIYGGAKLSGELMTQAYARSFDIEYTIIRPSAVYGPTDVNQRVVQTFMDNALTSVPLVVAGAKETILDFTYVKDLADGCVLATLEPAGANDIFNITRGQGRSLYELVQIIKKLSPYPVTVIDKKFDKTRPKRGALGITKAIKLLGYAPKYDLEKGIREYMEFAKHHLLKKGVTKL